MGILSMQGTSCCFMFVPVVMGRILGFNQFNNLPQVTDPHFRVLRLKLAHDDSFISCTNPEKHLCI